MTVFAIACAALGAVCAAVGAKLQHTGVRSETGGGLLRIRMLARLPRNRSWLLGFVALFLCAVLQIVALTFAPVTVVAPLMVLALPIVTLLNARAGKVRLDARTWLAVTASSLAVGVFVSIAAGTAVGTSVRPETLLDAARLVGVAIAVLCVLALFGRATIRCAAFATAAGVAYGLVSVLVRDVGYGVRTSGVLDLPLGSAVGLVVAFVIGSWLIQLGYSSGPADIVVGFQTVLNPLVATAIGMTLLGETATVGAGTRTALLACGAVAVTGVAVLARRHPEAVSAVPTRGHGSLARLRASRTHRAGTDKAGQSPSTLDG